MQIPDTPLFVKTHDYLLWLLRHTQRFPKSLRHSFTNRLERLAFDFQEAVLMANCARGNARREWLDRADGRLVCLRALQRLAHELELLSGAQLKYAAERVDELGRLLGSWKKGTGR
jgi:hypothetical protein